MHTPFDGSQPLFKIGLEPLDLSNWIKVDDQLGYYLAEKQRLAAHYPEKIFVAEKDTRQSQQEVLDLLIAHLCERFVDTYKMVPDQNSLLIGSTGNKIDLQSDLRQPLQIAAELVQEDLILMRKGDEGWRLAAASLCFPSSWRLLDKFSLPLDEIHAPVPGFGPGSKNATMMARIFDNLKNDMPVCRWNWSIYSDDELFHGDRDAENLQKFAEGTGRFLRIEYQTLRRLEQSGDILFTVRIFIDPLNTLEGLSNKQEVCQGFIKLLKKLTKTELSYKGLTGEIDGLIAQLKKIGAGGSAQ